MKRVVAFQVLGFTPVPWTVPNFGSGSRADGSRFRFSRRTRKSNPSELSPDLDRWQKLVKSRAVEAMNGADPCDGPVLLTVSFVDRTPPGKKDGQIWFLGVKQNDDGEWVKCGRHEPDLTNLIKAAEDPMEGVVYRNDYQVRGHRSECVYGQAPGIWIFVSEYEESDYPGHGEVATDPGDWDKARRPRKKRGA